MKSNIFFQESAESRDLHAVIVDQQGRSARVPLTMVPDGILRMCDGLKIEETGQVFRDCRRFSFPTEVQWPLPTARVLYAHLKCNYEIAGHQAMVFRIGLKADNGFSIPTQDVIDKVYVEVDTDHPTQLGGV